MSADFSMKWRAIIPFLAKEQDAIQSDATTQASHGLEGPPEKETDNKKAETQSNDKWAWRTAHTKKGKVGGPSGVVGRPAHGPHRLQAPRGCPLLVSYVGSRRNIPIP